MEHAGGSKETIIYRMELTAVIEGLRALKKPCEVALISDSTSIPNPWNLSNSSSLITNMLSRDASLRFRTTVDLFWWDKWDRWDTQINIGVFCPPRLGTMGGHGGQITGA